MDVNNGCFACYEEIPIDVQGVEENCNVCSAQGRYVSKNSGTSYCVLCGVSGTSFASKPLEAGGKCYDCSEASGLWFKTYETCLSKCPNRVQSSDPHWCRISPCSGDTPLYSAADGKCHPCDYGKAIPLSQLPNRQCKELCGNRKAENGMCILESCPSNKPLMDVNNGCFACNEEAGVNVQGVESNCNVCSSYGRYVSKNSGTAYCVLCGVSGTSFADKPLEAGGVCYNCNEKNNIWFSNYTICTSKCPNRKKVSDQFWCGLDYCTEDVPLMDIDRNCHPCNEPLPVDVDGDETKCGACLNRTLDGRYCILN